MAVHLCVCVCVCVCNVVCALCLLWNVRCAYCGICDVPTVECAICLLWNVRCAYCGMCDVPTVECAMCLLWNVVWCAVFCSVGSKQRSWRRATKLPPFHKDCILECIKENKTHMGYFYPIHTMPLISLFHLQITHPYVYRLTKGNGPDASV